MRHGLDTSVLVRLLTGQPAIPYGKARAFLVKAYEEKRAVLVSDLVVAEAWYALKLHYKCDPDEIRSTLSRMFASGLIQPEPGSGVREALADAEGPAGFVDRLLTARYARLEAETLTFDAGLAKLPGARKL